MEIYNFVFGPSFDPLSGLKCSESAWPVLLYYLKTLKINIMRRFTFLIIAYLFAAYFVSATDMNGTYKVGAGGAYTTLSAAIADINSGTISGNIVLEITSDITEPTNFGLAKSLGIYKLTIRPDADADRTITFTQAPANAGPFGHFVIGCATGNLGNALSDATVVATDSVTIDGFAVGGNTRRLNFVTPISTLTSSSIFTIVGGGKNIKIKNCTINNQSSGTAPRAIYILQFKGTTVDASPENVQISNNIITANNATVNAYGIQCNRSGSATTRILGLQITNNVITASGECVEVNYCNGINISGNELKIQKANTTGSGYAIWLRGSAGDMNVFGNKFTELSTIQSGTGTYATHGIFTGATSSNPFNVNIYNNTFSGMNRSVAGPAAVNQAYIAEIGYGTTKIYHNSFYLPALTLSTLNGAYNAISFTTTSYKADVQNNIFISNEDAKSVLISKAITTGTVNNNIYYLRAGNTNARIVDTYTTFSDYRQANSTLDVNSKSINVNFQDASTGNLLIGDASVQDINLKVPSLSAVTTDILGKIRDVNYTYAGAHESTLPFFQPTGISNQQIASAIRSTITGIQVQLNGSSDIEIYTANGLLIDKTRANGVYNRSLRNGVYIVTIDGKATKFVK